VFDRKSRPRGLLGRKKGKRLRALPFAHDPATKIGHGGRKDEREPREVYLLLRERGDSDRGGCEIFGSIQ